MALSCLAAAAALVGCSDDFVSSALDPALPGVRMPASVAAVAALPAPAASDCPGFKTGMMRVIRFGAADAAPWWFDAKAMTATTDDLTYTITKNAPCDYSVADGVATPLRMQVWSTGVAVFHRGDATSGEVSLVLPEQQPVGSVLAAAYARAQ